MAEFKFTDAVLNELFAGYVEETRNVTLQGFLKYVIKERNFDPRDYRKAKQAIMNDEEVVMMIKDYSEGNIIENGLAGTNNTHMVQFILRNRYDYERFKEGSDDDKESSEVVIKIVKDD